MSEIALYNTLRKIDGVSDAEAKEAVTNIANAKDVATKADLIAEIEKLKGSIVKIETELKYMRWVLGLIFVMNVAILMKLFF